LSEDFKPARAPVQDWQDMVHHQHVPENRCFIPLKLLKHQTEPVLFSQRVRRRPSLRSGWSTSSFSNHMWSFHRISI